MYQIDPSFLDQQRVGVLRGHQAMISSIEQVSKTPMLCSVDDAGYLKLWDIRSYKCLQTVNVGSRFLVNHILDLSAKNMLGFIGSRLNVMCFDEFQNKPVEDQYPIRIEYDRKCNELIVGTRKDIRYISMEDGKPRKIIKGLLRNCEDEITNFRTINSYSQFIVSGLKGNMQVHSNKIGEFVKNIQGHQGEVTALQVDYKSRLIVSAARDSAILVQQEVPNGFEVKRMARNCHFNKEVTMMALSIYHNLLLTGSTASTVYVWSYDSLKLAYEIALPEKAEPTLLSIINGLGLILVGANDGRLYLLHVHRADNEIALRQVGEIDLLFEEERSQLNAQIAADLSASVDQTTRKSLLLDVGSSQQSSQQLKSQSLSQLQPELGAEASSSSKALNRQSNDLSKRRQSKLIQLSQAGSPFNSPFESLGSPLIFLKRADSIICDQTQANRLSCQLQAQSPLSRRSVLDPRQGFTHYLQHQKHQAGQSSQPPGKGPVAVQANNWGTKVLYDLKTGQSEGIRKCKVYVGMLKGGIQVYSLLDVVRQNGLQIVEAAYDKPTYNPFKMRNEDFLDVVSNMVNHRVQVQSRAGGSERLDPVNEQATENESVFSSKVSQAPRNWQKSQPATQLAPGKMCESKEVDGGSNAGDAPGREKQGSTSYIVLGRKSMVRNIAAHREALTALQLLEVGAKRLILTGSADRYIRIWRTNGTLVANLNINHHLPILWDVQVDKYRQIQNKLQFSLKILDTMVNKYPDDPQTKQLIRVNYFINEVLQKNKSQALARYSSGQRDIYKSESVARSVSKELDATPSGGRGRVALMRDEYDPKDIRCENPKRMERCSEVQGPSIVQIELNQRREQMNKQFEESQRDQLNEYLQELSNKRLIGQKEKIKDNLNYLSENYHASFRRSQYSTKEGVLKLFSEKLDQQLAHNKAKLLHRKNYNNPTLVIDTYTQKRKSQSTIELDSLQSPTSPQKSPPARNILSIIKEEIIRSKPTDLQQKDESVEAYIQQSA